MLSFELLLSATSVVEELHACFYVEHKKMMHVENWFGVWIPVGARNPESKFTNSLNLVLHHRSPPFLVDHPTNCNNTNTSKRDPTTWKGSNEGPHGGQDIFQSLCVQRKDE